MTPDADGLPKAGSTRRTLGIAPNDIPPGDLVRPGTGGMSVALGSFWNLPAHRRPRYLGRGSSGSAADHVYVASVPFDHALGLAVRESPPEHHADVEPRDAAPRSVFESAIQATRPSWRKIQT